MTNLLDRRSFIAKSAGIGALGGGSLGTAAFSAGLPAVGTTSGPAAAQGSFRLFDSTRFVAKPEDLAVCGLQWLKVVYPSELWPRGDRDEPDLAFIEETLVPRLQAQNPDRLVLDIEHWELDGIDKLVTIIEHIRQLMPGVRLGYYSLVPVRDYWAFQPGREGRLIVYAEQTRQWAKLADAVDDLYPTLYTYYPDQEGWLRFADGTIAASKAIGKPVYPFLWPQYHDHNKKIPLQIIEGDFWLRQLDKVRDAGCDGAVIWGTLAPGGRTSDGKISRLTWDPQASWWLQTQAFAREAGLAENTCR